MFETEDPYGLKKRYEFAENVVKHQAAKSILEIGCGTGALLLQPLAARYPHYQFVGVDSDPASIDYAVTHFQSQNLHFYTVIENTKHDVVIASEVLEHVDQPLIFLKNLREHLAPNGVVLLTVPNGYGAFEWVSALQIILNNCGLLPRLQHVKRKLFGYRKNTHADKSHDVSAPMTLAISPHINFFGFREIQRLIGAAGYEIEVQRNRTWLCGFLIDMLISRFNLSVWNANIADRLPPAIVSDWMFVLKARPAITEGEEYRAGYWALFRRWLNRKGSSMSGSSST